MRRLWQSQDVRVSRLTRVRYGSIVLPRDLKVGKKLELTLDEIKTLFAEVKLAWPTSRDVIANDLKKKAKNSSIKQHLYGSGVKAKSSKKSKPHSAQKHKEGLSMDAKSVKSKASDKK